MSLNYIDWGTIDYKEALDKQEALFNDKVNKKLNGDKNIKEDFIVCEHPHVYTIGLHGKDTNMLVSKDFLDKINAKVYHINRGGDITYHGYGQIVGYPIIDLDYYSLSIRTYIYTIEQMVIDVMKEYDIKCERLQGATGVWIDTDKKSVRKICAIGVKASRDITMHGFAMNVKTDLKYFSYINPCGFVDKGVTSMEKELNQKIDIDKVRHQLFERFKYLIENR
jgi:lipoyl(octanoyl) transferase